MGYMIRFRSDGNVVDAEDYRKAGRKAKDGIATVMDAIEANDMRLALEGAEKAWNGVKEMCEISDEMERRFSERGSVRDHGRVVARDGYHHRGGEWNERDDEWMERRMRDAHGRYA